MYIVLHELHTWSYTLQRRYQILKKIQLKGEDVGKIYHFRFRAHPLSHLHTNINKCTWKVVIYLKTSRCKHQQMYVHRYL